MNPRLRSFRYRALTSLLTAIGFLALLVSGAILFLSPPGRIANWTQWQILGLTKHGWGDLHIAFGAVFIVTGLIHVTFNWRPLLQHLRTRLSGRSGPGLEVVAALVIGAAIFAGTRAKVPPFSTLLAWSEQLRGSWEDNRQLAPIPHAELLSLAELANKAGLEPSEALRRLEASGVTGITPDTQVQAIADRAGITPAKVYERIQNRSTHGNNEPATGPDSKAGHRPPGPGGGNGNGNGKGPGPGGGPGWKTLAQFCTDEGLDAGEVASRLARRSIRATPDQTLREIATANGFDRPYALLEVIRQK